MRLDQVRVAEPDRWRRKHWRTLEQAYGKAPCFTRYRDFFHAFYERRWETLNALNRFLLTGLATLLEINPRIVYASELAVSGRATERIINLVRAVGGTAYYTGAFALREYLDAEAFAREGIELVVQRWQPPVYQQLYGPFVPDLSIVDLLMNHGPESRAILLGAAS